MKNNLVSSPLDSFPIIRSRDIEEVREAVARCYGARRFDVPQNVEGFDVRANHWQSRNIGLSYCRYGAPVQLEFPAANFFRQQICLRSGSDIRIGRIEGRVTNEESCVVPPETSINVAFAPDFEQLVLRIETDALLNKLTALIGRTPSRKLVFGHSTRVNAAAIGNLRRMLTFLCGGIRLYRFRDGPIVSCRRA